MYVNDVIRINDVVSLLCCKHKNNDTSRHYYKYNKNIKNINKCPIFKSCIILFLSYVNLKLNNDHKNEILCTGNSPLRKGKVISKVN